jgi:hypothetical protein
MRENQPYLVGGVATDWAIYPASGGQCQLEGASALPRVLASLLHTFGPACKVPVAVCGDSNSYEVGASAEETTLGNYCGYLEGTPASDTNSDLSADSESNHAACRYLKDWHIALARPQASAKGPLYETPWAFRDDWLNGWHDSLNKHGGGGNDYRFLYAGPKGSWTPMHHDVLLSYSWSVNLVGRKRWLLFPPTCTPDLVQVDGSLIADLRPYVQLAGISLIHLSCASAAITSPLTAPSTIPPPTPSIARVIQQMLVIDQGVNEALFVPSGWHHQVLFLFCMFLSNHV